MSQAIFGGKGIRGGMGGAEHTVFNRHAGEGGAEQHLASSSDIPGIIQYLGQGGDAEPEGFPREHDRDGISLFCDGGLERVRQRVDPGAGGDAKRLREGQRRIEDGNSRHSFGIETSHLLVGFFIGDEGGGLTLAAGAGCGGNGNHGQHGPGRFADAPIIAHGSAVGQKEIAALGGVHGAAAAKSDDGIDAGKPGRFQAFLDASGRGVFGGMVKNRDVQTGGFEILLDALSVSRRDQPTVRDQEDAFRAEVASEFASALNRVDTENEPGPGLKIEWRQGIAVLMTGVMAHAMVRRFFGEVCSRDGQLQFGAGDRATFVEKLEHVAFVRLVPGNPGSWDWPKVEAIDEGTFEQFFAEGGIIGQGGHDQGRSNLPEHFVLRNLNDAGIRKKEFTIREGMRKRIAEHNSGTQIGAAFEDEFPGAFAMLCRRIGRAWLLQPFFDRLIDEIGHFRIGKTGKPSVFVFGRTGKDGTEFLSQRLGNFSRVAWHHDGGSVDATSTAVISDAGDYQINKLGPLVDLVFADKDFAVARAMNFNGGVIGVQLRGAGVAEEQGAPARLENLSRAFVIGWIKTKGFGRTASGNERLNEAVRCPGLFLPRLDDDGDFERDRWQPERIYSGRVAGHDQSKGLSGGIETQLRRAIIAGTVVENGRNIQAAAQSPENGAHMGESIVDFGHVAPDHDMRQAAGGGERLEVLLGGLCLPFVAEGQGAFQKEFAGVACNFEQF